MPACVRADTHSGSCTPYCEACCPGLLSNGWLHLAHGNSPYSACVDWRSKASTTMEMRYYSKARRIRYFPSTIATFSAKEAISSKRFTSGFRKVRKNPWGRDLEDNTEILNARFALSFSWSKKAISSVENAIPCRTKSCHLVRRDIYQLSVRCGSYIDKNEDERHSNGQVTFQPQSASHRPFSNFILIGKTTRNKRLDNLVH